MKIVLAFLRGSFTAYVVTRGLVPRVVPTNFRAYLEAWELGKLGSGSVRLGQVAKGTRLDDQRPS